MDLKPSFLYIISKMRECLEQGEADDFLQRLKSFLANIPGVINRRNMVELNFENIIYVYLYVWFLMYKQNNRLTEAEKTY